jgi:hypothetical protein
LTKSLERTSKPGLSLETDRPRGDAEESLAAARLRYRWCQRWTESLTRLRRQFDGDLDQYLLLLVFEQGEMARALAGLEGAMRRDRPVRAEPRGMNAMSVAEICGIPRETARRKLRRLIARQAISLGTDGLYYLAMGAAPASERAVGSLRDLAEGLLSAPLLVEAGADGCLTRPGCGDLLPDQTTR